MALLLLASPLQFEPAMKRIKALVAALGAISVTTFVTGYAILSFFRMASAADNLVYNGIDMTPVKEAIRRQMRVVKKPFHVYDWFASSNSGPYEVNNPVALAKEKSRQFLDGLPRQNRIRGGQRFGWGFYLASDVFTPEEKVRGSLEWRLMDIEIPQGSRVLDLRNLETRVVDASILDPALRALHSAQCLNRFDYKYDSSRPIASLLSSDNLSEGCSAWIRKIFVDLQIDGVVIYNYGLRVVKSCVEKYASQKYTMNVILSSDRMLTDSNVKLYGPETTTDKAARADIESLFIMNDYKRPTVNAFYKTSPAVRQEVKNEIARARPDIGPNFLFDIYDRSCLPGTEVCMIEVNVSYRGWDGSDETTRFKVTPPKIKIDDPRTIESGMKTYSTLGERYLHWQDLLGEPLNPDVTKWVHNNLLECGPEKHLDGLGKGIP